MPKLVGIILAGLFATLIGVHAKAYYNSYVKFRTCVEVYKLKDGFHDPNDTPETICARVVNSLPPNFEDD